MTLVRSDACSRSRRLSRVRDATAASPMARTQSSDRRGIRAGTPSWRLPKDTPAKKGCSLMPCRLPCAVAQIRACISKHRVGTPQNGRKYNPAHAFAKFSCALSKLPPAGVRPMRKSGLLPQGITPDAGEKTTIRQRKHA